ncbi:MAG: NADH-quinone oxidoreductase subunit J [Planctomycetes bacterium]|nr:NADH-quinone oxidoreductase subunit J [Planctomycetota bacterium]
MKFLQEISAFDIYFLIFACISVLCSIGLLFARHPITGAVSLIGVMLSLAGIYSLLQAPFLGVIQILVYTGAIMMLVVFVIMVLNSARDEKTPRMGMSGMVSLVVPCLFLLCMFILLSDLKQVSEVADAAHSSQSTLASSHKSAEVKVTAEGSVQTLGKILFDLDNRAYYILFEVIGLVLLTAIVGAVMLAKRDLSTPHVSVSEEKEGL